MSIPTGASATLEAFNQFVSGVEGKLTGFKQTQTDLSKGAGTTVHQNMDQILYVDPTAGNDSNDARSWFMAAATIEGAVSKVPVGGFAAIYLKAGVTHRMTQQVDLENRSILLAASTYDYYVDSTYIPIESVMYVVEDGEVQAGGFKMGRRSFLRVVGCKLITGKYTAAQASLIKNDWQSSFISSFGSKGTVFLEHCQIVLNNGQFTHQHTGGSIGTVDLYMRNVDIVVTAVSALVVTARSPYLIGQYAGDAMPFFAYGIEMSKASGVTWASLIYATTTYATTNLKD